jgi:tetratricopeptide (TPR) repeat protein
MEIIYFFFFLDKSNLLFKMGRFEVALDSVREAANTALIEPFNQFTYANSKILEGVCLYRLGEEKKDENYYWKAILCFDDIIERKDVDDVFRARAFKNKGNALSIIKKYHEAIECYGQAINLVPVYPSSYINKGNAHYGLKEYKQAIGCYDTALSLILSEKGTKQIRNLNQVKSITYLHRGQSKYNLGDIPCALTDFQSMQDEILNADLKALKYNNIGLCYYQKGQFKEAETSFEKARNQNYNLIYAHYNLAAVYNIQNKKPKAKKELEVCLSIDKNFTDASVALKQVQDSGGRWQFVNFAQGFDEPKPVEIEPAIPNTNYYKAKSVPGGQ